MALELVVGMGEYTVTDREDDVVRTFALASCVAVTAYCPIKKVAGMIHVVLPVPLSGKDEKERPSYFAQTGIPLLIHTVCMKYGCKKENLQIQLFGGAESALSQDIYNIGSKNIDAVKLALTGIGLAVYKTDLRGSDSRTISMEVKTGAISVYRQPILR